MVITILYLQTNEENAKVVKEQFDAREVECLIASSASEAFTIYEKKKVLLTLAGADIPDMTITDYVDKVATEYPDMLLNICIDSDKLEQVGAIANKKCVKKIFLAPWDAKVIVDGVNATIEKAKIASDFLTRKRELLEEETQFESTLAHLKDSLVKQQYSYNKIKPFFDAVLAGQTSIANANPIEVLFVRGSCDKMMLLQTATTIKPSLMAELIASNLEEIHANHSRFEIGEIKSSLEGSAPKYKLADIVYLIWMITYVEVINKEDVKVSVDSNVITANSCKYVVTISNAIDSDDRILDTYAKRMLQAFSDDYEVSYKDGVRTYSLSFELE